MYNTTLPHHYKFKAINNSNGEEVFFYTLESAKNWLDNRPNWILKQHQNIVWSFPLNRTIVGEAWVKVV